MGGTALKGIVQRISYGLDDGPEAELIIKRIYDIGLRETARRIGISPSFMVRWTRRETNMGADNYQKLLQVFRQHSKSIGEYEVMR